MSTALPDPEVSDFVQTLTAHREAWENRPLLRFIYRDWYGRIQNELSAGPGPTVELGSGIGAFKEFRPPTVATDAVASPWADQVVDAQDLPFDDASVENLIMIDVLHHLPRPARFMSQAVRVLRPRGRVVLMEPYCSPVSTWVYKRFHQELTDLDVDPFGDSPLSSGAPFDSNQALATLMFWRDLHEFERRFPELDVRRRMRLGFLAYPLSGGFTHRPVLPNALGPPLVRLEQFLSFAAPLFAFRCLVTLERRPDPPR